ncbi:MAG: hypothetical protein JXM79_08450 [Sedimentisphaerales bacterium]|nr:hypothetical protein [Sedimentisphaerales bacterium]
MTQKDAHRFAFAILFLYPISICPATVIPDPTDPNRYLNPVREFTDNMLKYGWDPYGSKRTPFFVKGLNFHSHERIKWILPNLASQQNMFCTLGGLTRITGDMNFRQAEMEAIGYAFDREPTL